MCRESDEAILAGDTRVVTSRVPEGGEDGPDALLRGAWYQPGDRQPLLEEVLERVDPKLVVISVGSDNKYGHPDDKTVQLLCSRPGIRFAHSQPTGRCYCVVYTRGPFSCSGTVEVLIREDGMDVVGEDIADIHT
jgi:hypothetical protein